jgi:HEAT repeat protein
LARELKPWYDDYIRLYGPQLRGELQQMDRYLGQVARLDPNFKNTLARENRQLQTLVYLQMMKTQKLMEPLVFGLWQAKNQELVAKLRDPDPLVRGISADILGRRQAPVEKDLVALLKDPDLSVRQSAHQALVHLARGTDCGPGPLDAAVKIDAAIEGWNTWLALQDNNTLERMANGEHVIESLDPSKRGTPDPGR